MDRSLPGSSVRGIFQAKVLEWVAISSSRRSSQPRDQTWVSHTAGRHFTIWATMVAWSLSQLRVAKKMEIDSPTLPLSCVTFSKCRPSSEPWFPHLSLRLILTGLFRLLMHRTWGLECFPESAQTFAQLITVMTGFSCKRGLGSHEVFGILSWRPRWSTEEPELAGRQGPKCQPASFGVQTGLEFREQMNDCGSEWLEKSFSRGVWSGKEWNKVEDHEAENLVFSEPHNTAW